jgi:drug/metabolite transporter (DMT)-like permease
MEPESSIRQRIRYVPRRALTSSTLAMLALGALGTGVANAMVATAAGRTNATAASAMGFIIPAVSLLLGAVGRHEHVHVLSNVGGAICVVAAALIARTSRPRSTTGVRDDRLAAD